MATEDISRNATSPRKRYAGVRLQQGRVTTDDDYNEGARLDAEQTRRTVLDLIGPAGSPDSGFAIGNPRINTHGDLDFDIGAGSLYLGGLRLESFGETYTQQTDWLEQLPADRAAPADGRTDLVYLMAWEQPVEAIEDSELFETALGGPDTSTRVRLMRRVVVAPGIAGADCAAAWAEELQKLTAIYGSFDASTGLCEPDSILRVTFDTTGVTDDLCSPSVVGGYLGAENQAIRVQIVDGAHFTWGFDNASPLYRVTIGADRTTVTLQTEPKDQAHWMQSGQTVEILAWSGVLPNGEKLAEIGGHLTTVAGAYDPDLHTLTLTNALPALPPPGFGDQWQARDDAAALGAPAPYFFMRIWSRGSDTTSPAALQFTPGGAAVTLGHTGVMVALSGTVFVPADYWVIAARPEDPTGVVPWDLLQGREPHGIKRYFTPLGRISWSVNNGNTSGTTVDDCRTPFQPLTRRQTCCTFTVGDGVVSHGDYTVIQEAIDHLPPQGGCICILPGTYAQDFHVDRKRNIRIEGCGPRTKMTGAKESKHRAVVSIIDSSDIVLTGLAITSLDRIPLQLVDRLEVNTLNLPIELAGTNAPAGNQRSERLARIRLRSLSVESRDLSAVVFAGGRFIELCESEIVIRPLGADLSAGASIGRWPAVFIAADDVVIERNSIGAQSGLLAARQSFVASETVSATANAAFTVRSRLALGGIQIAGGSDRVAIRCNRVTGGAGDGITLGSIAYVPSVVIKSFTARSDFLTLTKQWRYVTAGGHLVVDANGCIQYVPNPTPPNGPDGNPLVPVSTGNLSDIRIEDNEIADMGQSGIAVAMLFDLSQNPQAIIVDGLVIEENRITGCLQVELPEITGTLGEWVAYGAIALAVVTDLRIHANTVATNGRSHLQPTCGVFLQGGTGVDMLGNTIRDNGPRTASTGRAQPGLRGGIFLGLVESPAETIGTEARPAARIHDNIVVCQDGHALVIVAAVGPVSVVRNALTSRGAGFLSGDAAGAFVAGQGGFNLNPAFLAYGACVVILDLGVSSELVPIGSFAAAKYTYAAAAPAILPRGALQFSENQVLLEVGGDRGTFVLSSVFLMSFDDVSAQDNQMAAWSASAILLTDLLVIAGSLRITGNRLSETLQRCYLSALGIGVLATASLNQSTHCLYVFSALGSHGQFLGNNIVLVDAMSQAHQGPPLCPQSFNAPIWK
jgi:hypothetical protein